MRLKNLFSDTILYGLPRHFGNLLSILIIPIYLRIFSPSEYGAQESFQAWINTIVIIVPLGLFNSLERYYVDETISKKKLIGTTLSVLLLNCLIYTIGILCCKNLFINLYIKDWKFETVFYLSIPIVVLTIISNFFLSIFKIQLKSKLHALIITTNLLVVTLLGFALVYFFHFGIEGIFYAGIFSLLVGNIISLYLLRRELSLSFNKEIVKILFSFGIHYFVVSILVQVFNVIDRYLINHYLSLEHVGYFSLAYKIAFFTQIFITPFTLAWMPYAYRLKDQEGSEKTIINVTYIYFLICSVLVSTVCLFRKELIFYFSDQYGEAYTSIGLLSFLNFIMGLAYFFTLGIPFKNKTYLFLYIAPITSLLNFFVSLLGVKLIGLDGIAFGSLVGGICWIGALHYFSQKLYKIRFNYISYLPLLAIPVFFLLSSRFFDNWFSSLIATMIVKVVIMLLVTTSLLYFTGSWKTITDYLKNRKTN